MTEIDWQLVHHYSKDTIDGFAITIRFGIIVVIMFLGTAGLIALLTSLKKKKEKAAPKKPARANFLVVLPLMIIIIGLSYGFYQTVRDPYAYHGKIIEKYKKSPRWTEYVVIEIDEAHFFSENGKGDPIDKTGRKTVRVTPVLYDKIVPGSETILLFCADDRGYGQIFDGDVQVTN